jgi:hypothetical protein
MLSAKTQEKPRSLPPLSLVEVEGDGALCDRLGGALRRALQDRGRYYHVQIDGVGCVGEVLIRVSGVKGRLPLMFDRSELEPAFVHHVVRSAVEQYEL